MYLNINYKNFKILIHQIDVRNKEKQQLRHQNNFSNGSVPIDVGFVYIIKLTLSNYNLMVDPTSTCTLVCG